ncbi:DUF4143 domain-containing protein [Cellulosimicrobium funkei]|uniref:ATP-binding protein n=1 Tax=Cellulosimicrobium funkei TaxID=264251 RepID=UPI00203FC207|nr:DUF4143 domain-containing protein [Cellulosimicrobium funkei]MCM3535166.1 DUF4143 domain-containing protein [Cellulosimicrobium funkei]
MAEYRRRVIDDVLDELVAELPAIELHGPKGVGKTATALQRARTVMRLDDPRERELFASEPARIRAVDHPLLVDEWQRVPESWDAVRRAVDDGIGTYLLTGSSVPVSAPVHSGAGRFVTFRMRPMSLLERGFAEPTVSLGDLLGGSRPEINGSSRRSTRDYVDEIVRSGFPDIHGLAPRARRHRLEGYIDLIVTRAFPEQGLVVRRPGVLRAWLTAYAAATSTTATYQRILDAATPGLSEKPARSTVTAYRDVLDQLWMLDPVEAWLPGRNHLARLARTPKHQLADPGLAAHLLGADQAALLGNGDDPLPGLRDGTLLGSLFEHLVTLDVQVYAERSESRVRHLRTADGTHEVDIVVERPDGRVLAIEVKLASSVTDHDVRHLAWLRERIGDDLLDAVVVTPGPHAYRRRDGIAVVPAALLGP